MSEPETSEPPPERRFRLARLSGKATAASLAISLILIGLLIPSVVQLPLWIRFEIVLAAWWVVWVGVLTRMLYVGHRVTSDHQLSAPRNWLSGFKKEEKKDPLDIRKPERSNWSWWNVGDIFSGGDAEGCAFMIALVVAVVLFVALIWFLIEIAIPVLLFLLYLLVRGMLAHVINDRHRCRGNFMRALCWAYVWATVYTAPLALCVWFIHFVQTGRAGM